MIANILTRAEPAQFLSLAAILFSIGVAGFLTRKNALIIFMSIELMLNAVNLTLVTFSKMLGSLDGQVIAFFVIVVAAAEAVVGLALILSMYRRKRTASVDEFKVLRW